MKEIAVYNEEREKNPCCGSKWTAPCQGMPTAVNLSCLENSFPRLNITEATDLLLCRKVSSLSAAVGICTSLKNFLPIVTICGASGPDQVSEGPQAKQHMPNPACMQQTLAAKGKVSSILDYLRSKFYHCISLKQHTDLH